MKTRRSLDFAAALLTGALGISPAQAADHGSHAKTKNAVARESDQNVTPRLILSEPNAEILKGGHVYLPFRVENLTILPLYSEVNGEEVTKLKPTIGHLHVGVDDNKWVWIHASTDPVYFGELASGPHQVRVELVDAAHRLIEVQTIEIVVP